MNALLLPVVLGFLIARDRPALPQLSGLPGRLIPWCSCWCYWYARSVYLVVFLAPGYSAETLPNSV